MNAHELAWHMERPRVQIYDAPDHRGHWLTETCQCPACAERWQVIVPLNSTGAECPYCGYVDVAQHWTLDPEPVTRRDKSL
jgi:hypothetical protein